MRRFMVLGFVMALMASGAMAAGLTQVTDDEVRASFQQVRSVSYGPNGVPNYVVGKLGNIGRGDVVGESLHFLQSVRPILHASGDEDFALASSETDKQGWHHVKFQQYINGLKVHGAEMVVHSNARTGDIEVLHGQFIPDSDLPRHATMDAEVAFESAALEAGITEGRVLDQPELTYVAENGKGYLAYAARVAYVIDDMPLVDRIYADANTGELVARRALVYAARNRKIYNGNHTDPNNPTLPGTLMFQEGATSNSDAAAWDAYTGFGYTYDYFYSKFGRDSINGSGMAIIGTVHIGTNWVNAYWNGSQMCFGDGDNSQATYLSKAIDVVAHELTHGITEFTANLAYQNDSGAINEAMSDIFGAAVEAYRDGAVSANTWKVGEACWTPNTAGDALRYMNNPTQDGSSPDYYPERNYATGCSPSYYNDYCGVHTNSGIGNLAFYLLSQGGTHPRGKTTTVVTGIGIDKAGAIFYKALTSYMTSSTTYAQARTACKSAAEALYGAGSAEATQSENAWAAVGVGSGTTPPATVTTLSNGVAVASQGTSSGAYLHYKITVPSGQTQLQIVTTGGTGDADMYVKNGSQASSSNKDYSSTGSTCAETVTISNPAAADWYIALYAYSTFSGVTIKATYTGGTTADFAMSASPTSLSLTQGTSGTSTITTTVTGGFSSAIALTASGTPSGATVSFSPTSITGAGTATMTVNAGTAAAGSYTITVTGTGGGKTHTATVGLTVTASGGGVVVLSNGVAKTGLSGATGSWTHYKITVPTGQTSLSIVMSGGTGDADMYVKKGAQPTSSSYDYRPYLSGNNETVTVSSPAAADWYISLYGYSAYATVSLKATYSTSGGGTGSETESNNTYGTANSIASSGSSLTGKLSSSSDVDWFKVSLPASRTITVNLTVPSSKDYDIKLYDSNGTTVLATGSNGTGSAETISYTNGSTAKTVYMKVYGYNGAYSTTYTYTIKATW